MRLIFFQKLETLIHGKQKPPYLGRFFKKHARSIGFYVVIFEQKLKVSTIFAWAGFQKVYYVQQNFFFLKIERHSF